VKEKVKVVQTRLAFILLAIILIGLLGQSSVQASYPVGTIAYVHSDQIYGDEIHLIEPDGSGDRVVYATGKPISEYLTDIKQLEWKPDATELAFTSSHEAACSLYDTDIYTIRPDGSRYRRVSGPPACGAAAGLPTGTVVVPLKNNSSQNGIFTIYFEGAPGPIEIALSPGSTTKLTFNKVADYGDEEQWAIWMYGEYRNYYPGAAVDVIPGKSVQTGTLEIGVGLKHFGYAWPNYVPDGSEIGAIFHESDLIMVPSTNADMGFSGSIKSLDMTLGAKNLAWGPTLGLKNSILFHGWITDKDYTSRYPIMMADIRDKAGFMLIDVDPTLVGKWVLGITWLPDGSGFLYSLTELVGYDLRANIWEYSFSTGKKTQITNLSFGFARGITISPDGKKIVFEHQPTGHWIDVNPPIDLWMMNRDGSSMGLFVEDARSPAWSSQELPAPLSIHLYLPAVLR
jgi:hypothetical protein